MPVARRGTRLERPEEAEIVRTIFGAYVDLGYVHALQRQLAKYDHESTDGLLEHKLSRWPWEDRVTGTPSYTGDKLKLQNGFGAWQRVVYWCHYGSDENEDTFGRYAEWIAAQFKSSIVTSESGFEPLEFLVEALALSAAPGSSGSWESSRCTGHPAREPRIRKAQDRSVCRSYCIDPADRSGRSWPSLDPLPASGKSGCLAPVR